MRKNKLYLVKREVWATNIKTAMISKGSIYSVELADDKFQPLTDKPIGFKKK